MTSAPLASSSAAAAGGPTEALSRLAACGPTSDSDSSHPTMVHIVDEGHPGQLLAGLNACRQRDLFTDVRLCLGQEEIPCHRVVLAASSPYFEAMFSGAFREQREQRVEIADVSPWVMRRLLDFLYTGELVLCTEEAQDLLSACHLLGYGCLVEHCCRFMARHLDASNCLRLELLASLYGLEELRKAAHDCAERHFTEVVAGRDFLDAPASQLVSYLASDWVDVPSEDFMLKAVLLWGFHDADARRTDLINLLTHLRWPHISRAILDEQVRADPLVTAGPAPLIEAIEQLVAEQSDPRPAERHFTIPSDCLVVFGGINTFILNCAQRFDAKRNRWTDLAPMPASPAYFASTVVDNEIFVSGGILNSHIVASVYRYSPRQDTWRAMTPMLHPRARHASITCQGRLIVMGGITQSSDHREVSRLEDIETYDVAADQWSRVGVCPQPCLESSLVSLWTGTCLSPDDPYWMLIEVGGTAEMPGELDAAGGAARTYGNSQVLPCYRLSKDGLSVSRENQHFLLPKQLRRVRAVANANRLYILCEDSGQFILLNMESSMRHFRWLPSLPLPRHNFAMCVINREICVTGGHISERVPCDRTDWFDLDKLAWREGIGSGLPRACHGCVTVRL